MAMDRRSTLPSVLFDPHCDDSALRLQALPPTKNFTLKIQGHEFLVQSLEGDFPNGH